MPDRSISAMIHIVLTQSRMEEVWPGRTLPVEGTSLYSEHRFDVHMVIGENFTDSALEQVLENAAEQAVEKRMDADV